MLQFVIIAQDGTDAGAINRRMAVRPLHLKGAAKLKETNNFILGGAILNKEGTMTGSVMVVQFDTEDQMKNWFENEPYVTGDVWQKIEVKPFKVADV